METNAFSNEADWYIDATVIVDRYGIHVAFNAIDGVAGFTNIHDDLSVAIKVDGNNRRIVFIPNNFSVESFHQSADRNHGSPVAVDVWSSITFDDVVVHNIFGGVDGHNYGVVREWIFSTEGVFEGAIVGFITSLNNNINVGGGFFIRIEAQSAFTIAYSSVCNINRNLGIFVALVCNECANFTIYLLNLTVFINNRYSNLVVFVGWALYRVEFKALIGIRRYHGQSLSDKLLVSSVKCNNFNFGTKERLVGRDISWSTEGAILWLRINNSEATVETIVYVLSNYFDTICINIFCSNSDKLAESDLIVNGHNVFVRVTGSPVMVRCVYIKNCILSFAELSCVKSYSSFVAINARKSNAYSVLTRNQISLITFVEQGVNAIARINKAEIITVEFSTCWLTINIDDHTVNVTSYFLFFIVQYFELNCISEPSIEVSPVCSVSTSENIAASQGSVDINSRSFYSHDTNDVFETSSCISDGDDAILIILHGESGFKLTIIFSVVRIIVCIRSRIYKFDDVFSGSSKVNGLLFSDIAIFILSNTSQIDFIYTIKAEAIHIGQFQNSSVAVIECQVFGVQKISGAISILGVDFCLNIVDRFNSGVVGNIYSDRTSNRILLSVFQCSAITCINGVIANYAKLNLQFVSIANCTNFVAISIYHAGRFVNFCNLSQFLGRIIFNPYDDIFKSIISYIFVSIIDVELCSQIGINSYRSFIREFATNYCAKFRSICHCHTKNTKSFSANNDRFSTRIISVNVKRYSHGVVTSCQTSNCCSWSSVTNT